MDHLVYTHLNQGMVYTHVEKLGFAVKGGLSFVEQISSTY